MTDPQGVVSVPPTSRDPDVIAAKKHTDQLLAQAERLTRRLHSHLDEIQRLIDDRRNRA